MYQELFQLTEPPFRLSPDPQFLFASKQHARAKAYMESTIWLTDGFVVVTGDIGSGKTTLIEAFLDELPEDVALAQIVQTQLSPVEFLQSILVEFGFKPFKKQKVELMSMLRDYLVEQFAEGNKVLLVVDEAQNLSFKVLEEIRLLSGIESQKEKVLRIVLAGQPELNAKLDSPRLEQLTQRVRLRFHLGPLSKRETREYIEHRLRVAGAEGRQIFSKEALDLVFRYTGGVPRLVNTLCDTALICAFSDDKNRVDDSLILQAVDELQWVEYTQRKHGRSSSYKPPRIDPSQHTSTGSIRLATLDVRFKDESVSEHELGPGRTIVGRTSDNDLQIRSRFVSRHHAQITSDPQQSVIEDLNSTNGLFVNSKRVKHHRLKTGDEIQLGEHTLVYEDLRNLIDLDDTSSRKNLAEVDD